MIASSIAIKIDDDGQVADDKVTVFDLYKSDNIIPCSITKIPIQTNNEQDNNKQNSCTQGSGNEKCEL